MNEPAPSPGSRLKRRWQSRRNRRREAVLRLALVLAMTIGTLALIWGGFHLSGTIITAPPLQR